MIVTFIDAKGALRRIEAAPGLTLMEAAKANDVDGIYADCGGACSCAICHVWVSEDFMEKVGKPGEIELAMLDMVADAMKETSRLACQIKLSPELDGLCVTVAPSF